MPLYKYKCNSCGREFLELRKMDEVVRCSCGGETYKLVTAAYAILRGDGFYKGRKNVRATSGSNSQ